MCSSEPDYCAIGELIYSAELNSTRFENQYDNFTTEDLVDLIEENSKKNVFVGIWPFS